MVKHFNSFVFLAALLCSCNQNEIETAYIHVDACHALVQPIQLREDTTRLYLEDYFPSYQGNCVIIWEGDTMAIDSSTNSFVISKQPSRPIAALELNYDGSRYSFPVYRNEKLSFEYAHPDEAGIQSIALAGSFNGWNPKSTPLEKVNDHWTTSLLLDPGLYSYQVVINGEWQLDKHNPSTAPNGMGAFNSTFRVGEPPIKEPRIRAFSAKKDTLTITADSDAGVFVWWENQRIAGPLELGGNQSIDIAIPNHASQLDRSHLRVYACNPDQRANDLLIPLRSGAIIADANALNRHDRATWNMYFALIDRFSDGDSTNNQPVDDPEILPIANHFGGDLAGIHQRVSDGYFEKLGVNAVWISPIARNADGAWGLWDKGVRSKFSGYHGYWPIRSKEIDAHFGDSATFSGLIQAMHAKNMNILVDYVANHVHQDHPVIQQNPDWATPLFLPDGRMNTELWDEQRLTTWFDTFLPTLDLERQEVTDAMTDSALYWIQAFQIDGFRHDATKHIPDNFWRTLTLKIKRELATQQMQRKVFQIGETYGNPELISSYISSGLLDAQFDFNLYDAAVDAFAKSDSDFENLIRVLRQSLKYYGSHHRMGNISGNQDRARFISYADGAVKFDEDPKLAGWTRKIENQGSIGFDRLALLHAFNLTIPGIPCLYYGDEIGMPGANDPDNRRQMTFSGWTSEQQEMFDLYSALSKLRRQQMSLMYGDFNVVYTDANIIVYDRTYLDETTRVALAKKACTYAVEEEFAPLLTHRAKITGAQMATDGAGIAIWSLNEK